METPAADHGDLGPAGGDHQWPGASSWHGSVEWLAEGCQRVPIEPKQSRGHEKAAALSGATH